MGMLYNFGISIGQGKTKEHLTKDWDVTKKDFKEMGSELKEAGICLFLGIGHLLSKSFYPITGNLSDLVQIRLEKAVGDKHYNHKHAGMTSLVTNPLIYLITTYYLTNYFFPENENALYWSIAGSLFYSICETPIRAKTKPKTRYNYQSRREEIDYHQEEPDFSKPVNGSLLGKIASLPLETMIGIYDGMKQKQKR